MELECTYDDERKKTKSRIHWISETDGTRAEIRLYDYLFLHDDPTEGGTKDPMDDLNDKSLIVKLDSFVNKDICTKMKVFDHFQFERLGFFVCDPDTQLDKGRYVFNLTVDLGDGKIDAMRV